MTRHRNWSDGESNPDLLNAIQQNRPRKGDGYTVQLPHSHFGDLTIAEAFELKDLIKRRRDIVTAIPLAGNEVTAARIDELQAKRLKPAEVAHG